MNTDDNTIKYTNIIWSQQITIPNSLEKNVTLYSILLSLVHMLFKFQMDVYYLWVIWISAKNTQRPFIIHLSTSDCYVFISKVSQLVTGNVWFVIQCYCGFVAIAVAISNAMWIACTWESWMQPHTYVRYEILLNMERFSFLSWFYAVIFSNAIWLCLYAYLCFFDRIFSNRLL